MTTSNESSEDVGALWIGTAYAVLRRLEDGKEPYAASVLPMARAIKAFVEPLINDARSSGFVAGRVAERADVVGWLDRPDRYRYLPGLIGALKAGSHVGAADADGEGG